MLVINTNAASLNAQRNLATNQSSMQTALQRLSSGLRINSAKDDAAGMVIADGMTAQIRGLNMAVRNANDGISLAQTAEGAMNQLTNNMQRIRELAVQASNGTLSDRSGLQAEVDQLTQEISRIVQTTSFNGVSLFDGTSASLDFQIGADGDATNRVNVSLSNLTGAGTLNTYNATLTNTGTVNISTNAAAAQSAIADIDADLSAINSERIKFGATQTRFEAVISNLQNYAENLTSARSRIMDADFAAETANLTKSQILQQASVSMLAQANSIPQAALSLLGR